jgi:hypothetical protein
MDEKYLSDDERGVFREWENMFASGGWALLRKELEAELKAVPEVAFYSSKSYEEVVALRVRAKTVAELLSYESIIEQRKESIILGREQEVESRRISDSTEYL